MAMRLLTFALLFFVSPLRVLASPVSLSTGPAPDGEAVFTVDPFGSLVASSSTFDATNPNDRSQRLGAQTFVAHSYLGVYYFGTSGPERYLLNDLTRWEFCLGARRQTDPGIFDPANDSHTSNTRTTRFRLTTRNELAALEVHLHQQAQGTELTQVYTFHNQSARSLTFRAVATTDADIEYSGGYWTNRAFHRPQWPGARQTFPLAATITDATELIGVTVALEGGTPSGWRTLRAISPGWEGARVANSYGYEPQFLNGIFTFPPNNPWNGPTRPFADEIPDDLDGDSRSESGDVVIGQQTLVTVPAGGSTSVTYRHVLFSGGPYWKERVCPLPNPLPLGAQVQVPLRATSGYGALSFLPAPGLPPGVRVEGSSLVGRAETPGWYDFALSARDERGREDVLGCAVEVPGICQDGTIPPVLKPAACEIAAACPCDGVGAPWSSHGAYLSCVVQAAQQQVREGELSDREKAIIVSHAARSQCP